MSDWLRWDPQRPRRKISMRLTAISAAACALTLGTAYADDGLGLKRSGNRSDVSISGLSSGAAMACSMPLPIPDPSSVSAPLRGRHGAVLTEACHEP